jgi:aerotolerance regulator-like protein/VWA domain-containing protein
MPFSFLNAAFLVGLAAAALPIVIHLFSRRRVAKVPFPSLQFLEEITRRRLRRMKLTQWLILALRVLALALLALALGRPALRGEFAFGKSRGESAVALILDGSYSMRAEGERTTLWDKAKERTREVVEALEPDDTVFLLGVDPTDPPPEPYGGKASAAEAIRGLEPGYGTTDLAGAVGRATAALAGATALNKELFVVSDFQKHALVTEGESPANLLNNVSDKIRVFLVPVDEGPIPNTALVDARLEGSPVDERVYVEAARQGGNSDDDVAVTVESGSEVLGEGRMLVPAGSRENTEVPLSRAPAEGEPVRARLSRDRLDVDDVRYLATLGSGAVTTWIVQDPARPSPYLPLALSPEGVPASFTVSRMSPTDLVSGDLSDVRLVILDNVTGLPEEALARLRTWRTAGGMIFIVLGDRVDLRAYNENLLPALFPHLTLGNVLGSDASSSAAYTLTARNPGHRAFSGFGVTIGQPITGASFWHIVAVTAGPGLRTLAEFGPGLPALVQGDGALLFASSLDGRWNNFPTHAAFVPLLHQSLEAMLSEGSEGRALVGERLVSLVDPALVPTGSDLVAIGPEGLTLPVEISRDPRGIRLQTPPAPVPGFYEIRAEDRVLERRVVNVNAEMESDLTPASREELRQAFPGDHVRVIEPDVPIGTPVREARFGREIWKELVLIVLILLVTEGWLSRRGVTA